MFFTYGIWTAKEDNCSHIFKYFLADRQAALAADLITASVSLREADPAADMIKALL